MVRPGFAAQHPIPTGLRDLDHFSLTEKFSANQGNETYTVIRFRHSCCRRVFLPCIFPGDPRSSPDLSLNIEGYFRVGFPDADIAVACQSHLFRISAPEYHILAADIGIAVGVREPTIACPIAQSRCALHVQLGSRVGFSDADVPIPPDTHRFRESSASAVTKCDARSFVRGVDLQEARLDAETVMIARLLK